MGELVVAQPHRLLWSACRSPPGATLEDLGADLVDRRAVEDDPGVDVHVVDHPVVGDRVGGDLEAGRGLAAVDGARRS
jgi:hypothetical protein